MTTVTLSQPLLEIGNTLGEGPLWHPIRNQLFWVNIIERKIHQCDPDGEQHQIYNLPAMPGSLHLTADPDQLLVTSANGLLRFNIESGNTQAIEMSLPIDSHMRFNDGKTDPSGRLWAGTMHVNGNQPIGHLLRIDNTDAEVIHQGLTIPNGLAWTGDDNTLYHIDSPTRQVMAYPFSTTEGALGVGKTSLDFQEENGVPDGMTIDSNGCLWIAFWGSREVRCYDPVSGLKVMTIGYWHDCDIVPKGATI